MGTKDENVAALLNMNCERVAKKLQGPTWVEDLYTTAGRLALDRGSLCST